MRLYLGLIFSVLFIAIKPAYSINKITLDYLIFDDSTPFHLKILDAIPDEGKIQIGPDNAKNTIIEFFDYYCGYCKKIHPELIDLAKSNNDLRVVFIQHPILNESSNVLARIAIAATMQNKGFELHHALFSIEGSITSEKLQQSIKEAGINEVKLKIDMERDGVKKIIKLSSFLASGAGARGTPSIFVNEEFIGGYLSPDRIEGLLK
jgi:protein-disulfide isomerase|tara:strand:+ start:427 stop:1047 length:621 start_codon:yes stop_codon:yes gene_type:complete